MGVNKPWVILSIEVKPVSPKGRKFHCCTQGTIFPHLSMSNELRGAAVTDAGRWVISW